MRVIVALLLCAAGLLLGSGQAWAQRHKKKNLIALAAVCFAAISLPTFALAQDFQSLGFLPGGASSSPNGVSADGSVVVGISPDANGQAFRWTQSGGMTGLGLLPGGSYSNATAVSADGSVVVGFGTSTNAGGNYETFRWVFTGAGPTLGTMTGLGFLPGGTYSFGSAVNADGSVVVGDGNSTNAGGGNNNEAFRWFGSTMTGLGFLPGKTASFAAGVSADG